MSVNFTDNGDETSDCDVCGETIDNDHYGDMQVHDEKHAREREEAESAPRYTTSRDVDGNWHVLEKNTLNGRTEYFYESIARTMRRDSAQRIADALGRV